MPQERSGKYQPLKALDPLKKFLSSRELVLILLQITSLVTTVQGASIILFNLPGNAYIFLGVGIQFILWWLFTKGKDALKSPATVWTLAIVYTVLSIYTSFFSLYEGISRQKLDPTIYAKQSSLKIEEIISKDPKFKVDLASRESLLNQIKDIDENINKICKGRCEASRPPEKTKLEEERIALGKNLSNLAYIDEFKKFQLLRGKKFVHKKNKPYTAEEIDVENKKIISLFEAAISKKLKPPAADSDYKLNTSENNQTIKALDLLRNQSSKQNFFLFPFEMLIAKDINAIIALLIAIIIDCTSILIGLNPGKFNFNNLKSFSDSFKLYLNTFIGGIIVFIPNLLHNTGHAMYEILRATTEPLNGSLLGLASGFQRLANVIYRPSNAFSITGSRHDFLSGLHNSIESSWADDGKTTEYHINYGLLMRSSQSSNEFKHGFDVLIRRLLLLEWLEKAAAPSSKNEQNSEIRYKIKKIRDFDEWYMVERNRRFSEERHDTARGYSLKTVIYMPRLSKNE
jgi:hypothetical protein